MRRVRLLLLVALATLTLAGCERDGVLSGMLVRTGVHSVTTGQTVDGDIAVLGGRLVVESGGRITGSAYVAGGDLQLDGSVDEDVTVLAGSLVLGPNARVARDLILAGGSVERAPDAIIGGRTQTSVGPSLPAPTLWETIVGVGFRSVLQALALGLVATVLARRLPSPVCTVGSTALDYPIVALALGLLVIAVVPALLVLMALTLVLIPIVLLTALLLAGLSLYGWLATCVELSDRVLRRGNSVKMRGRAAFAATVGLTLGVQLVASVPVFGWIAPAAVLAVALGAVLLTMLGTRTFVPA